MLKRSILAAVLTALPVTLSAQDVDITVQAEDESLERVVRSASLLLELTDNDEDNSAQDFVSAARADYRRILTALYAAGYYSGVIGITVDGREAAGIAPLDAPASVGRIDVTVQPGPLFSFGTAQVAPVPPGTELPEGFASGKPALSDTIRDAVRTSVTAWRDAGHAKAEAADQQIVARHDDTALDASVAISPGPRLTFGDLTITGNEAVRTSAVRRIAGLPVGEVYSPDEIDAAQRRLRGTGTFDSVALTEADDIGPNDTLPMRLVVTESLPRRIGFGLELSSVEGLRVSSYWLHRNIFGGAERLRVEGQVAGIGGDTGGIDYAIATSLAIPAIYGADTDFLATARLAREDEPDYLLDSFSVETRVTRRLSDDLEVGIGLGLLAASEETPLRTRDYVLLTAPLSATYDRRDSQTNAKNGYYIDTRATPFLSIDGGADGARLYVDGRGYASFGAEDRFTFAARAQIGTVLGADETNAPADFLFFSGGSGTVRGQGYKSLGLPRSVLGEDFRVGGTSFAGAQVEARLDVTDNIGVVGFYDYGYVGSTAVPLEDGFDHDGVGLGIRYDTGIGPIRLDVGTPASGDDAFDAVEVYIGIGQAF
jgi:translocation and assembly module TamA